MKPDLTPVSNWLKQLKSNSTSQQLIAVHNGYCLWLGLLTFEQDKPYLLANASSTAIDAVAAVAEAKQQLTQHIKGKLPRQITLVSSCALPALLDIPIDADKPRKPAEMESMISWELEAQVADNNDLYTLGAILNGRGIITADQRHETAVELETRRVNGNSLTRYGEVAIDLNFINNEQLQESLQLQEKLVVSDTQLACGWQVQTLIREDNTEHQWLVAGIDSRVRRQWFSAFNSSGLKLTGIYPLLGSAAPCAALQSETGNLLIVEASQDALVSYRLERSQFASFQLQPRQHQQSLAEQCFGLVSEQLYGDTEQIWVIDNSRSKPLAANAAPDKESTSEPSAGQELSVDNTATELSSRLQRDVSWLVSEELAQQYNVPDQILAAFFGTAIALHKHVLFSTDDSPVHIPQVPPREPPPPIWRNKNVYRYGIPAVVLMGVMAHAGYSLWQQSHLQGKLDTLDAEYEEKLKLNKQLNTITGEYKRKEDELTQLQQQANDSAKQFLILNDQILNRTRLVPRLVKTIALSVTNNVMLDSILEPQRDGKNRFNLTAWAIDNPSASEFIERLQQLVGRLNYRVADPDIKSGIGRYGLNGYTIDLWLIPVATTPSSNTKARSKQ